MKILGSNESNTKSNRNNIEKDDIELSHIVSKKTIINLRTNNIHKNSKSNIWKFLKKRAEEDSTINGIESRRMNKAETLVHLTWT